MLSIYECEKILNRNKKKYSAEQIKSIRETLFELVEIVELMQKKDETINK